jgi:hypothetical protein
LEDFTMGYERYFRSQGDYGRERRQDDDRGGRGYGYRGEQGGYEGSGGWGDDRDEGRFGGREYGSAGYAQDYDRGYRGERQGRSGYGGQDDGAGQGYGRQQYGQSGYGYGAQGRDDDRGRWGRQQQGQGQRGYGRQPQGYDYEDRGFVARAGDEVRSWFGDEEAERRREQDARMDERYAGRDERDDHYHAWRRQQIDALDRDYAEYRQENRQRFHNEFSSWRTGRQGQRDLLKRVDEHMEVVGSDGQHVGTVDKVRGDRIILTKNDQDAGGRHHSFASSWIQSVDDKVTLSKTAADAKQHWKDEERQGAFFGQDNRDHAGRQAGDDSGAGILNKSFSGTY